MTDLEWCALVADGSPDSCIEAMPRDPHLWCEYCRRPVVPGSPEAEEQARQIDAGLRRLVTPLVERLRSYGAQAEDWGLTHGEVEMRLACGEAADEIERLRAEVQGLRNDSCGCV